MKEEIENAEAEISKCKLELAEQTDMLKATTAREVELVKQREELLASLQSQQANLNSAIDDRDATIKSMRDEHSALSKELEVSKEAHALAETEAKDLTCTVANLQARLNKIEQHNESNMESNMMSQDIVKKMTTTLHETKQLLNVSVSENRGLLEQRDELNQAFKVQKDMLVVVEKAKREAEEKVAYLEKTVESAQADLAAVDSQVDVMRKEHKEREEELTTQMETLARDAASNHALALSAQQSLLLKQTELDALHRQCTELISAAISSPEESPQKHNSLREMAGVDGEREAKVNNGENGKEGEEGEEEEEEEEEGDQQRKYETSSAVCYLNSHFWTSRACSVE